MSEERRGRGARFLDRHPALRRAMERSGTFPEMKRREAVEMDGAVHYVYQGDALGDEEDLYLDALVRGAAGQGELPRRLFEELDDEERALVRRMRSGNAADGGEKGR